jgi:serine/threonine-protein kinase HipA
MERDLIVYLDLDGAPVLVGRLWARERTGRETSSFTYDPSWIKRPGSFALAPSLGLTPGPHHTPKGLLAPFTDPAPDGLARCGLKIVKAAISWHELTDQCRH